MKQSKWIVLLTFILASCGSNLSVMPAYSLKKSSKLPAVFALDRLKAKAGELVEVSGVNLNDNLTVRVGGIEVPLVSTERSWGAFVMPAEADTSSIGATFYDKDKVKIATLALVNSSEESKIPIMDADVAIVCSDIIFRDPMGNLKTGSRNCSSSLPFCQSEGETACLTSADFPSVSMRALSAQADRIRVGTTVSGIAGTLKSCSIDGDSDCVADAPTYSAASVSGAAAKILSGQSVGGIVGTASLPALANVRSIDSVNGVAGTLLECNSDNGTNCVATAAYPSVILSNITAGRIKSGITVAGVSGQYPSATYPLAGASVTADLDNATFNAKIKSSTAFEYFNSAGALQTGAGNDDLTAANIKDGISIFGTSGTFGANCSADGQVGCLTTSVHKAVDTSALNAWDLRKGKSAGGIAGELAFYQDLVNFGIFSRTTGTAASSSTTVPDYYDTITNGWASATVVPPNFFSGVGSSWVRDIATDNGSGSGAALNGACDSGEACIFKDMSTGIYWSRSSPWVARTWEDSISYCDGLTMGAFNDWRVPTHKEMMWSYTSGMMYTAYGMDLGNAAYWSATTTYHSTGDAMVGIYDNGIFYGRPKTDTLRVMCVRP